MRPRGNDGTCGTSGAGGARRRRPQAGRRRPSSVQRLQRPVRARRRRHERAPNGAHYPRARRAAAARGDDPRAQRRHVRRPRAAARATAGAATPTTASGERFVRRALRARRASSRSPASATFSYLLPEPPGGRGATCSTSAASDVAGNRTRSRAAPRGSSSMSARRRRSRSAPRSWPRCRGRGAAGAARSARGSAPRAAPSVQSMVVGPAARSSRRPAASSHAAARVRVGSQTCAVAAGTPLAVLAALRRAGGPGVRAARLRPLRRLAGELRQLFVNSLGGEANRGRRTAGSTRSTASPAAPARPTRAARWATAAGCVRARGCCGSGARRRGGGCQRTLEVAPAVSSRRARQRRCAVTVSGYDNEGRAAPVAGAIVTLGSSSASTGANGRATIAAPSTPGSYQLQRRRAGPRARRSRRRSR